MVFAFIPGLKHLGFPAHGPNTPTGITIDYDFLKAMIGTGLPLYERRKGKPGYKVGDVLPVRETFRYVGYNRIQFKIDASPDDNTCWEYANTMPIRFARRHVRVLSISRMDKAEYMKLVSGERAYNHMSYGMPFLHIPQSRWFRGAMPPPSFEGEQWIVKYELIETDQRHQDDRTIIDFYSAVSQM